MKTEAQSERSEAMNDVERGNLAKAWTDTFDNGEGRHPISVRPKINVVSDNRLRAGDNLLGCIPRCSVYRQVVARRTLEDEVFLAAAPACRFSVMAEEVETLPIRPPC